MMMKRTRSTSLSPCWCTSTSRRRLAVFSLALLQLFWMEATEAWVGTSGAVGRRPQQQHQQPARSVTSRLQPSKWLLKSNALWRIAPLNMAAARSSPNFDSNDPWKILGLEPSPSLDKKDIKRAYKRLALKYHPDVVTGSGNNNKEAKKAASDIFAKINWAYETLMGKNGAATNGVYASSGAGTSSSSSFSTGWTPPHRRSSSSTSTATSSSSTENMNWRDFIPDYVDAEDAKYDAGGDSFGAIFSDLFAGAARSGMGAAGAGARIVTDFIEFLENNVDGYSKSNPFSRENGYNNGNDDDDAQLRMLLQTGSVQDIGDEMDDTELVLQQLKSKLRNVQNELLQVKADLKLSAGSSKYLEKMELDERAEELQARQKVVEGYIKKAQKRLLSLQTRYKQLIVNGDNDWRAVGGAGASKRGGGYGYDDGGSRSTYSSSSASSSATRPHHEKPEDAWKDESFGSFGRGRGSSRRRQRQPQEETSSQEKSSATTSSSHSPPSPSSSSPSTSTAGTSASRTFSSTGSSRPSSSEPFVPPHRRGPSSTSAQDDQRRLRELRVDDEFEKLKKELGL